MMNNINCTCVPAFLIDEASKIRSTEPLKNFVKTLLALFPKEFSDEWGLSAVVCCLGGSLTVKNNNIATANPGIADKK